MYTLLLPCNAFHVLQECKGFNKDKYYIDLLLCVESVESVE